MEEGIQKCPKCGSKNFEIMGIACGVPQGEFECNDCGFQDIVE